MTKHDYTAALEAFRDVGRSAMQDCGTDLSVEIAAIEHALESAAAKQEKDTKQRD